MLFQETTKVSLLQLLDVVKINAIKNNIIAQIPSYIEIEVKFDEDEFVDLYNAYSEFHENSEEEPSNDIGNKVMELFNFDDNNITDAIELTDLANELYSIQNQLTSDSFSQDYISEYSKSKMKLILSEVNEEVNLFDETEKFGFFTMEDLIKRLNLEIERDTENAIDSISSLISEFNEVNEKFEDILYKIQNLCHQILELDSNNYYAGSLNTITDFCAYISVKLDANDLLKPYLNDISASQGIELFKFIEDFNKSLREK